MPSVSVERRVLIDVVLGRRQESQQRAQLIGSWGNHHIDVLRGAWHPVEGAREGSGQHVGDPGAIKCVDETPEDLLGSHRSGGGNGVDGKA